MARPTSHLKIRYFKKVYFVDGEKIYIQPIICSNCGYDSATDEIREHRCCPYCGAKITGIDGILR